MATHGDGWSGEHTPTGTREWMMKDKGTVRLTIDEIVMLRRALSIASEDGSLFGDEDQVAEKRRYAVERKLVEALRTFTEKSDE
jgi:hypothetical protein